MIYTLSPIGEAGGRAMARTRNDDVGLLLGLSEESSIIEKRYEEIDRHFFAPVTRSRCSPLMRFTELYSSWSEETKNLSDLDQICIHPSYQAIIGMGPIAVPWILHLLKSGSVDHWFWALTAITGEDPVDPNNVGRIKKMAEDWILWGKQNGYL